MPFIRSIIYHVRAFATPCGPLVSQTSTTPVPTLLNKAYIASVYMKDKSSSHGLGASLLDEGQKPGALRDVVQGLEIGESVPLALFPIILPATER